MSEIPHTPVVEYMIAPPPVSKSVSEKDRGTIVYCIDISGSMSTTENCSNFQGNLLYIHVVKHLQKIISQKRPVAIFTKP